MEDVMDSDMTWQGELVSHWPDSCQDLEWSTISGCQLGTPTPLQCTLSGLNSYINMVTDLVFFESPLLISKALLPILSGL